MDNPFSLESTKEVYKNPWLTVREDTVTRPGGQLGIFGVVSVQPGVSILPVTETGEVYLIREYQYASKRSMILTISGGIDAGEDPIGAAKRELLEEAGLEASQWTPLGSVEALTTMVDCTMHLFLAQGLKELEQSRTEQDLIEIVKIPLEQAVAWAMDSKIGPAVGNVLVFKVNEYLKKH